MSSSSLSPTIHDSTAERSPSGLLNSSQNGNSSSEWQFPRVESPGVPGVMNGGLNGSSVNDDSAGNSAISSMSSDVFNIGTDVSEEVQCSSSGHEGSGSPGGSPDSPGVTRQGTSKPQGSVSPEGSAGLVGSEGGLMSMQVSDGNRGGNHDPFFQALTETLMAEDYYWVNDPLDEQTRMVPKPKPEDKSIKDCIHVG